MKILKSETFKENLVAFGISSLCLIVIYYLYRYFSGMSPVKQMKFALSNTGMFQLLIVALVFSACLMVVFCAGNALLARSLQDFFISLLFFYVLCICSNYESWYSSYV